MSVEALQKSQIVLEGIVGSRAYGLARSDSDEDRLGVYMATPDALLGLSDDWNRKSIVSHEPDYAYHELGKFCRLALQCNPTVMELLWIPYATACTEVGLRLLSLKKDFLSARYVRSAYLGYATSQLKRCQNRTDPRRGKHAMHMKRLLEQGYDLYRTGELVVSIGNPQPYFDFRDQIMEGNVEIAERMVAEYGKLFDATRSMIPEEPRPEKINQFLVETRKDYITNYSST